MERQCRKCKQRLSIDQFYCYKKTGYSHKCKDCEKIEKKGEYLRRRDKVLNAVHEYRRVNCDLIRSKANERYKNDIEYREWAKAYQVEYRKTHKDEINRYSAAYRAKNKTVVNKKRSAFAKTEAGKVIEKRRDCKRRVAKKGARLLGQHTHEEWETVLKRFNYSCAMCGSKQEITQDHIIPISKGGSDNMGNIQPLCRSCNSSKQAQIMRWASSEYQVYIPNAGEYL